VAVFKTSLTQLYIGYFGRAPEPEGLSFWEAALEDGFGLVPTAQLFATQPETLAQYPYIEAPEANDVAIFLGSVYQNLFGRTPDAAGLAFWTQQIEAGLPLGTAILDIIEGAAPADAATLSNKVDLACLWHDLAGVEPGFSLTPAAITSSRDALALVTSDPSSATQSSDAVEIVEAFFNDPAVISLNATVTSLAEDADVSQRIKVADILISDDGLGDNRLSLGGADTALFEIEGATLFLKADTPVDFETASRLDVTVLLDDAGIGGSPDASAALQIDITDVNEAPDLTLTQVVSSLAETADTTGRINVAAVTVSDDALGNNQLSLAGADAALFELDGTDVFLRAGAMLDADTQLDVTITVDDATIGTTPDDSLSFSLAITDVNTPPTVATSPILTTLPEDTDTTDRIKIADVIVSDDTSGTNGLTLSGADAALFEVEGTDLFLKAGALLDFETNPSLAVTIAVDDIDVGATPDDTVDVTVNISDVNELPELAVSVETSSFSENTSTSNRIKVADVTVVDDIAVSGALTIGLSGADAGLFELDSEALFLRSGTTLDFESNPVLDVTIAADDPTLGADIDAQQDLSFAVDDENEPPALDVTSVVTALAEDVDTASRIKVADATITDDAPGTNVLSLSGADAALFEIDGSEVFLRAGASLDFESSPALDLTVVLEDATVGSSPDDTQDLVIAVTDVNEPPGIEVTTLIATLAEDVDTSDALKLVDIEVTDDAPGTLAFSLSGVDASLFEVSETGLFLRAGTVLDFETSDKLNVTVSADDPDIGTGSEFTADFAFGITDVNEPPGLTLSANALSMAEDTDVTSRIKVADVVVGDDALGINTLSLTGTAAAQFELDGTALFLRAGAVLDFETAPALNLIVNLDDADVGGTPDAASDFTLSVTDVAEAPLAVDDRITTSEFLVNALTDSQQDNSSVATLSDGRMVFAWRSTEGQQGAEAGTGIKARVLNTDGSEAVPEFLVNDLTEGSQDLADVIALSGGGFVVTWRSASPGQGDTDGSGIKARVFDPAGMPVAGEFLINTLTDGDQSSAQISALAEGGFVATWRSDDPQQGDTADSGVKARIFDDQGQQRTAEFLVNTLTDGSQIEPVITGLSVGGFVVAWTSNTPGQGNSGIKARVFDAAGTPASSEFLANDLTLGGQSDPALASLPSGGFVAVWEALPPQQGDTSASGIKAKIFDNDGTAIVSEFLVNTFTSGFQSQPDVATLSSGHIVITWQSQDRQQGDVSGTAIKARIFDVAGQEVVPEFLVNALTSNQQATPAIAALDDGGFVITWASFDPQQGDDSGLGVKARAFDADGTARDVVRMVSVTESADFAVDQLLGNDSDPDGGRLTVTGISATSDNGAALAFAGGVVTYDPSGAATLQALGFGQSLVDSFTYTVTDEDGLASQATATLVVLGANMPPGLSVSQSVFDIDENTVLNAPLKVADLVITDDGAGQNDLALSGPDASFFEIDGLEVFLRAGVTLDFETRQGFDFTVLLDDPRVGPDPDGAATLTINVNNLNEAPELALSNTLISLPEETDLTAAFKVADITVSDDDTGTNVLSLTGSDAALFEIVGSALYLRAGTMLDFDTNPLLNVNVRVSDGQNPANIETLSIEVHPDFGFEIQSNTGSNGERLGHSVAFIGDLNQDGLSDILIGAPRHSAAASIMGGAYVIYGTTTPFPNSFVSADIPTN
jgi:VCBS repeat-containing protein